MSEQEMIGKKNELVKILKETEEEATSVQGAAQEAVEAASFMKDVANCMREVVREIPEPCLVPPDRWARLISTWSKAREEAVEMNKGLRRSPQFFAVAMATGVTTSTASSEFCIVTSIAGSAGFKAASRRLDDVLQRGHLLEDVRKLIGDLGLDHGHGDRKSPLALLEEASLALNRPGGSQPSPIGAWIALRGVITSSLELLLAKRRDQERAKSISDQVVSIGMQCGRGDLPEGHFVGMGGDAHDVIDNLSGAKEKDISHDRLLRGFNEGLLFLKAFLGSLDPGRFRS